MVDIEDWGSVRVVIDGSDVTDFRGGLVQPESWSLAEPFGPGPAGITISNVVPMEAAGSGSLSWLQVGNSVDIVRLHPDHVTKSTLWSGQVISLHPATNADSWDWRLECTGTLWLADLQKHKPPTFRDPTDIGHVIADDLNAVVSRRYGTLTRVSTGILTNQRGAPDSSTLEWIQELLATAVTNDGAHQWTVDEVAGQPRHYQIHLKDRTTVHWTVRAGQPGIDADLSKDASQSANVIYGRGISLAGYAWAGWVYPGLYPDSAPSYPFSGAGSVINIGTTDADTTSGSGVSTWQRRINEINITNDVVVDGVYNTNDAAACEQVQRRYGLLVDGIVGPQTWAATFDVGANVGDLGSAFRMPMAWDPKVMPRLYHADGSDAGANPAYDSSVLRVEDDLDFGSGISKDQGHRIARALLARDYPAGWVGTITLGADPNEGSMFDIEAGQNILLQNWSGANVLLHIASVEISPGSLQVTLTVDQKARDLVTIAQIIQRNRDNATNPARMPAGRNRRSRIVPNHIVEFDGESAGGRIPRFALYGGLWSVIRIPVSQNGRIASVRVTTTNPASKFALGLFGAPVTPQDLISLVGSNPLTVTGPWTTHADDLENIGWIEGWGSSSDACGYYPGSESASNSLTGRFRDDGSLDYLSLRPPWVWVALWAPSSCFVSGRLLPAPLDY